MTGTGFTLDLGRCVGCGACVLACRLSNELPPGVSWRRVLSFNLDRRGRGPTYHFSLACHHCERPACLAACPAGAYTRSPDGAVILREERCIGCRYCEMACPFGAPSYDSASGVMTKCHLCHDRLDRGGQPACVAACPTGALALDGSGGGGEQRETWSVPGFCHSAECVPHIGFIAPRGAKRSLLYQQLQEALKR